ncbi:HupE/UreJ family protein [Undibacterium sp. Jales W-56]|uniref:HupE/UreJ family protein n=1 Tax=Undibacterium sp. Jales W-56 TaxID=2897325 RepID=UPI0021D12C46|nr:HupE/UreJ family protein [Undibacterium sp. Jales W-56]MCU6434971.1 HupE/UreJ family protein [Undibacterium sp. Jales W-56]
MSDLRCLGWMRNLRLLLLTLGLLSAAMCNPAWAHKPSDSYLTLRQDQDGLHGQWDIALRDLDFAIGLDQDGNGELNWDEVRSKHQDIAAYALSRLSLTVDGKACPLKPGQQLIDQHSDGTYTVLMFEAACKGEKIALHYQLFFDIDPQHKGLLNLINKEGVTATAIFSPDNAAQQFTLAEVSKLQQFTDYVQHGVWHIWIGFDHILFLLSLLLPAVLVLRQGAWEAAGDFRSALLEVVKIVTAFTLAHSITLSLAALQIIALPSRWVESAIAASVILAALNNLFPLFQGKRWLVAFAFGLIHGFGFASVLADLGLPQTALVLALVGFNVGVELGQLTIVAAFLPVAYLLRRQRVYRQGIFQLGSVLIVLIAAIWLVERVFDVKLISA